MHKNHSISFSADLRCSVDFRSKISINSIQMLFLSLVSIYSLHNSSRASAKRYYCRLSQFTIFREALFLTNTKGYTVLAVYNTETMAATSGIAAILQQWKQLDLPEFQV